MPFGVRWAPRAQDDLRRLPPALAGRCLDAVDRLAADPVRLSHGPRLAHEVYQRYSVWAQTDQGEECLLTVLFQYSQDEIDIEIIGLGVAYF